MATEQPRAPRKPVSSATGARPAWLPAEWEPADASAVQALAAGTADSTQQKRALNWVIEHASGLYEISYRPGVDGDRETAFAEGRRFVGSQIVKMLKISVAAIRRGPQSDQPSEHG